MFLYRISNHAKLYLTVLLLSPVAVFLFPINIHLFSRILIFPTQRFTLTAPRYTLIYRHLLCFLVHGCVCILCDTLPCLHVFLALVYMSTKFCGVSYVCLVCGWGGGVLGGGSPFFPLFPSFLPSFRCLYSCHSSPHIFFLFSFYL